MPNLVFYKDGSGVVSGPLKEEEATTLFNANFFGPDHVFRIVEAHESAGFFGIDDLKVLYGAASPFNKPSTKDEKGKKSSVEAGEAGESKELVRVYKELASVLKERNELKALVEERDKQLESMSRQKIIDQTKAVVEKLRAEASKYDEEDDYGGLANRKRKPEARDSENDEEQPSVPRKRLSVNDKEKSKGMSVGEKQSAKHGHHEEILVPRKEQLPEEEEHHSEMSINLFEQGLVLSSHTMSFDDARKKIQDELTSLHSQGKMVWPRAKLNSICFPCLVCVKRATRPSTVILHFLSRGHSSAMRGCDAAVSRAAVNYWLGVMQLAAPEQVYARGASINIFQLCDRTSSDSISLEEAARQLKAKLDRCGKEKFLFYCRKYNRNEYCDVCRVGMMRTSMLAHFLSSHHAHKVNARGAAVSLPAVQYWLREMEVFAGEKEDD